MSRAILVVDDDPDQLELRTLILEGHGHSVSAAATPAEALGMLGGQQAVLMDLRLPTAADGRRLIGKIHASAPDLPIVVVSGFPQDIAGHPEESLVRHVLAKPVRSENLLALLDRLG